MEKLSARPGKIRLVKGTYEAPSNLARLRGAELDTAYCHSFS
jgi:hypothetical protein